MNTLKDFVNWKLTHSDKTAEASGYPLVMENCKANKKMKQLEVYGNSVQDGTPTPDAPIEVQSVGELVTDTTDINYGKYKIPVRTRGINLINIDDFCNPALVKNDDGTYTLGWNGKYRISAYNYNASVIKAGSKIVVKHQILDLSYSENYIRMYISYIGGGGEYIVCHDGTNNFTVDKDVNYMMMYIPDTQAEGDFITFKDFMICYKSESAPFEPYVEPSTTNVFLNEPLRRIGDYADYIDFKNKNVIRVIAHEKITQVAGKSSNGLIFLSYITHKPLLTGASNNPYGYAISDKFSRHLKAYSMLLQANEPVIQSYISTNGGFRVAYAFGDSSIVDASLAQEAIKDGFEVYYVVESSIEELIECDLPKLNAKTSVIEVDTNIAPGNMYGKYIKNRR